MQFTNNDDTNLTKPCYWQKVLLKVLVVLMVIFVLLMVKQFMRVELRYASIRYGELSAAQTLQISGQHINGLVKTPMSCVDNSNIWDLV